MKPIEAILLDATEAFVKALRTGGNGLEYDKEFVQMLIDKEHYMSDAYVFFVIGYLNALGLQDELVYEHNGAILMQQLLAKLEEEEANGE